MLGTGVFAAGALVFTARNVTLSRRTFNLTEQGQVTDRYTKAIEQLGSAKLDLRIGGIYALERVSRDSARDHPTVMEVLSAFIREHSHDQWPPCPGGEADERTTRPDVQAAITVIGRRDPKRDIQCIAFTGADLTGANLFNADLNGAVLFGVNLTEAILTSASWSTRSSSPRTSPTRTSPTRHGQREAGQRAAHRRGPHRRDMDSAKLVNARLIDADLTGAIIITGADLSGADLTSADIRRADLTDVRWPLEDGVPDGWQPDARLWPLEAGRRRLGACQGKLALAPNPACG